MINAFRGFLIVCCSIIFGFGAVFLRYFIFSFILIFIKEKDKKLKICSKILRISWHFFVSFLEFLKIIKINKLNNIQNIKNSIIVSTHPCFLDVVILMSIIPDTTCFVAEKLLKNPFFKEIVNLLFIPEKQDINQWLNPAVERLNNNFNLLIFPMGSRHKKNEYPKIKKGAALLAQKSHRNIVMIKIDTSYDFLTKNQPIYKIKREPAIFNISFLGEINTDEMMKKYPDEVTFRHEITNVISKILYK